MSLIAQHQRSRKKPKIALGTAQLGLSYGITNAQGMLAEDEALEILRAAERRQVLLLDTARAYGSAESRLGQFLRQDPSSSKFRVITKLSPLSDLAPSSAHIDIERSVEISLQESLNELGVGVIDTLLVHRWSHWADYAGIIRNKLLELRDRGYIRNLGASIATPSEFLETERFEDLATIQLPCNIVDHRWRAPEIRSALVASGKEIHVRSVFLQGLLSSKHQCWPKVCGLEPSRIEDAIASLVTKFNRINAADLCIAYMTAQPWVDGLVLGAETPRQLEETADLVELPCLSESECKILETSLDFVPEVLLNPALWPK